jgi:DNA helicase HerA-like ATPase
MGVPVFMVDVKGDVAGLAQAGVLNDRIRERVAQIGIEGYANEGSPVVFWDLYGKLGHPMRTTVSEMGPSLLARVLDLNDIQSGVLEIAFKLADDQGLLLLDLDDLRAMLGFVAETSKEISTRYGLVSPQTVAAIQRSLLTLETEGGKNIFGEPALELADLMRTDLSGRGIISILAADQLILKPHLYSSFLLWLLSELFENLPEVGDLDQPKLVFFFDEAHLLFDDAPNEILGQMGNRIQHALRAFTPRDQKAVKTAAETFVPNPRLDVAQVISQLGVGEALVSTLQDKGVPMPVEGTIICPPRCRMGAITPGERAAVRGRSPVGTKYDTTINRESAYEALNRRAEQKAQDAPAPPAPRAPAAGPGRQPAAPAAAHNPLSDLLWGTGRRQGMAEAMAKSAARTVGSQLGRQILRGVLGGILGGSRRT